MLLRIVAAVAAVLLAGCGYIGDPLPPLANIPPRVTDLAAVQRGSRVIVQFTVPSVTTENFPIPGPVTLDLRAGPADKFEENSWAASARHIPGGKVTEHVARYEIPAADWTGKDIIFGVQVIAGNGKGSGWSNFVAVPVIPAPAKPASVTAGATAGGVRVTWQAPGEEFRVFRKTGDGEYALIATVQKPEWLDASAEYGTRYSYTVQTVARRDNKTAESDLSEAATIEPRDTFPPAVPSGLRISTAPNSVELNWEPNTEGDLSGYRVYRSAAGGAWERVAEVTAVPSYSDHAVEHGKQYRYALTAVDRAGNESARSAAVEVSFL